MTNGQSDTQTDSRRSKWSNKMRIIKIKNKKLKLRVHMRFIRQRTAYFDKRDSLGLTCRLSALALVDRFTGFRKHVVK